MCALSVFLFLFGIALSRAEPSPVRVFAPEVHNLELRFQVAAIRRLSPTAELHVWMAEPVAGVGQDACNLLSCEPEPTEVFTDSENGNRILYFHLSDALVSGATIEVRRTYRRIGWSVGLDKSEIDRLVSPRQRLPESRAVRYMQSERWLEQTEEVKTLARALIRSATGPWQKVEALVGWIRDNCAYAYPPPTGRGALKMLEARRGDCGQYACLFIDLARAAGIPSRFVAGMVVDWDTGKIGHHAWAEAWFPGGGWVPVDPTHPVEEQGILKPNSIVITRGLNLPIPNVPAWADYENSEVTAGAPGETGRTEFIQNACVAARGFEADFSTGRRVWDHDWGRGVVDETPE